MRLFFVFIIPIVFSYSSIAQNTTNSIYIYDFRETVPDSIRAESFAVWFRYALDSKEFGESYVEEFGINIQNLAKAISAKNENALSIAREFDFYKEQEPAFKSKLIKYLESVRKSTESSFDAKIKTGNSVLVVMATGNDKFIDLGIVNTSEVKDKLKKLQFSENTIRPNSATPYVKLSGKTIRKKIPAILVLQRFERMGDSGISIKMQTTNVNVQLNLPSIVKAKPYIRRFFPSTYEVLEGERIAITWEVLGAKNVFVNNEVGNKPNKWQVMFSPITDSEFTLVATNESGTEESKFLIHSVRSVLMNATITYFSAEHADPKELNTEVKLELYDENMKLVAIQTGLEHMKISSAIPYSGPFDLDISGTVYKRDLKKGRFVVTISGAKSDEWMFSPILILNFSDGTDKKLYGYGNKTISTKGEIAVFEF